MVRLFSVHVPIACVALAFFDAFVLYVLVQLFMDMGSESASVFGSWQYPTFQKSLFLATLLVCLFMMGVYRRPNGDDFWSLTARIVIAFGLAFCLLTITFYISPANRIWMSALLPALLGSLIWLVVSRGALRRFAIASTKARVLVLGCGPHAKKLETIEQQQRTMRFTCVGFVRTGGTPVCVGPQRVLDRMDIHQACLSTRATEIVIAMEERRNSLPVHQLLECRLRGIQTMSLPSFIERELGHVEVEDLHPSWLIFSKGHVNQTFNRAMKRFLDIAVGFAALVFALPLMAVTALAILLEDGAPVLYRQERVGLYGSVFWILKFRSMRRDAEKDAVARWATARDPRVTRVGRVIRKVRVDELPQIWNVLKGDMSFVGPRPERPSLIAQIAQEVPLYEYRHVVKPGITGWAQINFGYGDSIEHAREKLKFDLFYIKNHSLFLDVIIVLQTARAVLWPTGAR